MSGLELTFYSGVYGTCIGAMTSFGQDAKSLIGISGICIGLGEILGECCSRAGGGGHGREAIRGTSVSDPSVQVAACSGC